MKVVIITGAASGIGLALSLAHLQKGLKVIMVDINAEQLKKQTDQLNCDFPNRVTGFVCDVTKHEETDLLAQQIRTLSTAIYCIYNNAGIIGTLAPVWELTSEQISQVIEVNLYGMTNMIRSFIPLLFQQNIQSRIINMASLYALCSGSQMSAYAMSKHAVLALSESLYFDLKRLEKPVDVSVVFPSFTDTALLNKDSTDDSSEFHNTLRSLLAHSRPAVDVAANIMQEVEQNRFYILPDKEVKGYCEDRARSIILQEIPHVNNVEKLVSSLMQRKKAR